MMIPLTELQKEIMEEFYAYGKRRVIFNKTERNSLWKSATAKKDRNIGNIREQCPALAHQIEKSYEHGNNIQSAVFSECVYAQTFADMYGLNVFTNCTQERRVIPENVASLLKSHNLYPRYAYSSPDGKRLLIQAGGCKGIDSALIGVSELNIYTIEFKEPEAKTSEPDLPKYGEDGKISITSDFTERYPQFSQMLEEQRDLNFFAKMGSNENNFSAESVNIAVTDNYTKKYADVVCTEDQDGFLVMLPVNQLSLWAEIVGEIRPAGRNHYKVWTPIALRNFITANGGIISGTAVSVNKSGLGIRKERGGAGKISGYKINPLFFVYSDDCSEDGETVRFDLNSVQQLNPTIAGKMFFKNLNYETVKKYYL